ncbi:MAG: OmpA family protein [Betaproteobacteria bacterium]|nr:OmpA family protein [Betaproteobacteria bacterium]
MKPLDQNLEFQAGSLTKPLGLALCALLLSTAAMANDSSALTYPTIVRDSNGVVVRNNYGECWGTGPNDTTHRPTTECGQAAPAPKPAPVAAAKPAPLPPPPPPAQPAPMAKAPDITLSADALFDFDKSVLKPKGKAAIDRELKRTHFEGGGVGVRSIKVVGNTDSVGKPAYNQKLSERRAEAVKAYLVSKGVPASKIHTEGHGMRDPVASNKTKEGRAKNRRADIWFETK